MNIRSDHSNKKTNGFLLVSAIFALTTAILLGITTDVQEQARKSAIQAALKINAEEGTIEYFPSKAIIVSYRRKEADGNIGPEHTAIIIKDKVVAIDSLIIAPIEK